MRRINDRLMHDLGGGPRPLKLAWVIDAHKCLSFVFLGALMWAYAGRTPAATSTAAWIYLALHGSYGVVWLVKDLAFPDRTWQVRVTVGSALCVFSILCLYWLPGWLLISGTAHQHYPLPRGAWFSLCISLSVIGDVIMIAADAQKHFTLRLRPGLITDGMFKYIRHPNYLGEMMTYGAFALLAWHWAAAAVLAYMWTTLFAVNMVMMEASMSRHSGWDAYRKRSWWLLPGVL
jgi:protein-S-isoprenylcysteine O-methyltransferase Ste14